MARIERLNRQFAEPFGAMLAALRRFIVISR
jgi:hypothetical protein